MNSEFRDIHLRKRKAIAGDSKTCSGCRTCEMICSLLHEGLIAPEQSRIHIKSNPFKGSHTPIYCHQCSDAPCLYACPESAITIDRIYGTVVIDGEKCSGCRLCEKACPFRVIRFLQEKNKVFKCDLCYGDPQCVEWCPMNALGVVEFGGEMPK
jgi:Fe-S-cluster-containing hydrogenase component 2